MGVVTSIREEIWCWLIGYLSFVRGYVECMACGGCFTGVVTSIREEVWMLVDWIPVLCERLCGVYGLREAFYGGDYVYPRRNFGVGCMECCSFGRLCGVYGLRGMFYGGGYVYPRTNLDTGCWDICPFREAFDREE